MEVISVLMNLDGMDEMVKDMAEKAGVSLPAGTSMTQMNDMMKKMMSNPKSMELAQKVQANPKILAALQDASINGPAALSKYASDPEVMSAISEITDLTRDPET